MSDKDAKALLGCLPAAWGLFITGPIWWVTLYMILRQIQATDFMWFLFFAYVPATVLGLIVAALAAMASEADK